MSSPASLTTPAAARRSPRRVVAVTATAAAMLLSACGDSADEATDTSLETSTTLGAETSDSVLTPVRTVDINAFCDDARELDALVDGFEDFGDPGAFEVFITDRVQLGEKMVEVAPDELVADLETDNAAQAEFRDLAVAAEWDFFAVFNDAERLLGATDVAAAQDRLKDYAVATCGVIDDDVEIALPEPEETTTTTAAPPTTVTEDTIAEEEFDEFSFGEGGIDAEFLETMLGTQTGRDAFIEGMVSSSTMTTEQGGCLLDNMSIELIVALANSQEPTTGQAVELLEALEICDIPLSAFG